jgi:Domain of unknown function (DUF4365)
MLGFSRSVIAKATVLTDQHIAESLSRAYVRAIAGRAGLNLAIREYDYGVDGSFDEVVIRQNRRVESGFSLSFQLKASTQWQLDPSEVIYDLEVKNLQRPRTQTQHQNRYPLHPAPISPPRRLRAMANL